MPPKLLPRLAFTARSASVVLLLLAPPAYTAGPGGFGEPVLPATRLPSKADVDKQRKDEQLKRAVLEKAVQDAEASLARTRSDLQAAAKSLQAKDDELRRCLTAPKPKPEVVVREVVKPDPDVVKRWQREVGLRAAAEQARSAAETRATDAAAELTRLKTELERMKKFATPAPGTALPKDCDVCPQLVVLPRGNYLRGSPETEKEREPDKSPVKTVAIGYSLAVGKYEVTFAEWDACVDDNKACERPDDHWTRGRQPVINVSWNQITQQYLPWLNRKAGFDKLDKKYQYRLLTEAEWEYVARGVTSTTAPHPPFPAVAGAHFADGSCIHTDDANYGGNYDYANCGAKTGKYLQRTVEVGSYKPNLFGLHDMAGNVWEWTQDCYVDKYAGVPVDGSPAAETANCLRVLRGGSWYNSPGWLRAADRGRSAPDDRSVSAGFRLTRMLP